MKYRVGSSGRLYLVGLLFLVFLFVLVGVASASVAWKLTPGYNGGDVEESTVAGGGGSIALSMDDFLYNSEDFGFYLVNANDVHTTMKVNGEVVIIDVRTPEEVSTGRIPGALAINLRELSKNASLLPAKLDTPIYVYCKEGIRSAYALTSLRLLGYTNSYNVFGGIDAWKEAGYPVEDVKEKPVRFKVG